MMKKRKVGEQDDLLVEDLTDLTSMVNVALILVIVFMCVTPLALVSGIKALSSKSSGVSIGKSAQEDIVKITVDENGMVSINGIEIAKNKIQPYLKDAILASPVKEVMIVADEKNLVNYVVYLMDLAKQNGAEKVSISR